MKELRNISWVAASIFLLSCTTSQDLATIDEIDDVYARDHNSFEEAPEMAAPVFADASDAEMSFYGNEPYDVNSEPPTLIDPADQAEIDYFDPDYVQESESPLNPDLYGNDFMLPPNNFSPVHPGMNGGMFGGMGMMGGMGMGMHNMNMMCGFGIGSHMGWRNMWMMQRGFSMGLGFGSPWMNTWCMYDPFCMMSPFNPWMGPGMNSFIMAGFYDPFMMGGWGPFGYNFNYWSNPYGPFFYGQPNWGVSDNPGTTTTYGGRTSGSRGQRGGVVYNNSGGSGSSSGSGRTEGVRSETAQAETPSGQTTGQKVGITESRQLAPAQRNREQLRTGQAVRVNSGNQSRSSGVRQLTDRSSSSAGNYIRSRTQQSTNRSPDVRYNSPTRSSSPSYRTGRTPSYGGATRSSYGSGSRSSGGTTSPSRGTSGGRSSR